MEATASDSQIEKFALSRGDVLLTKDSEDPSDIANPALVHEEFQNVICGYHLTHIKPGNNLYGGYLFRLIQSKSINSYFEVNAKGITRYGLGTEAFLNFITVLPPLPEQTTIANFLDHKTAQIDAAIDKHRQLIELLREHRAAIINEAVTAGVDENGQLRQKPRCLPAAGWKDSGVEWIGAVPAHWEVVRLKYLIAHITGGGTPSTENRAFWNGDIPWVSPKDMKTKVITSTQDYITEEAIFNSSTNLIAPDSLLIVFRSGILKHTLPVATNTCKVSLNQDMKAITPASDVSVEYLKHLHLGLENEILTFCSKVGATVDNIDMQFYLNFEVPVPLSQEEQQRIVDFIETETTRIDREIDLAQQEIGLLEEYRQSLIAEAVTGKIDVRDYVLED